VGGFWANPAGTFDADHGIYTQTFQTIVGTKITGSLVGVTGGRGFQQGAFYFGFAGSFAAGLLEGQNGGAACAADCYTSLNVLGDATLSAGLVFGQRLLVYFGGGPNFALMRSGQTFYGLHDQFVSGFHGTMGIKYAVDDHWAVSSQLEYVRVGDLYYVIPSATIGVNPHDFWMGMLGFEYWF
jgi:opacity protein-like surface antigen